MVVFPPSKYDTLPQGQLLRIAKSTTPEAQAAKISLLRAHEPLLKSKLKGVHPAIIEDAFQAAVLGFLEAIQRYDFASNVPIGVYASSWVVKEVKKLVVREARYYSCCLSFEALEDDARQEDRANMEDGAEEIFGYDDPRFSQLEADEEALERRRVLTNFISALSERERRVISLYYFYGWTQARIAKLYGISTVAVNKQIHRVLREGRECFTI